ncbi:hypothetical protein ABPG72_016143 [Tetrahymena utriculariae]
MMNKFEQDLEIQSEEQQLMSQAFSFKKSKAREVNRIRSIQKAQSKSINQVNTEQLQSIFNGSGFKMIPEPQSQQQNEQIDTKKDINDKSEEMEERVEIDLSRLNEKQLRQVIKSFIDEINYQIQAQRNIDLCFSFLQEMNLIPAPIFKDCNVKMVLGLNKNYRNGKVQKCYSKECCYKKVKVFARNLIFQTFNSNLSTILRVFFYFLPIQCSYQIPTNTLDIQFKTLLQCKKLWYKEQNRMNLQTIFFIFQNNLASNYL